MREITFKVFKFVWALYALLIFTIILLIVLPFYFLLFFLVPKKADPILIRCSHHGVANLFLALSLILVKVEGKEKLDPQESYVIISNHNAFLDILINAVSFPGIYKYLSKKENIRIPLFGILVRKFCILLDRRKIRSRKESFENMQKAMEEGYSILIYPEGSRNKTDQLLTNFYDGAFRLAIETGKPLAIQTILNSKSLSSPKSYLALRPGIAKVIWENPISTKGLSLEEVPLLKKQAFEIMEQRLIKYNQ